MFHSKVLWFYFFPSPICYNPIFSTRCVVHHINPYTGPAGKGAGSDETEDQRQEVAQAEDGAVSGAATVAENSQDFQGQSEPGFVIPGTIAIEDLDKLEGIAEPDEL